MFNDRSNTIADEERASFTFLLLNVFNTEPIFNLLTLFLSKRILLIAWSLSNVIYLFLLEINGCFIVENGLISFNPINLPLLTLIDSSFNIKLF